MPVEDFEDLAHVAPETVTLEFVNGLLEVKPGRDGNHSEVVMWLFGECTRQRTDLVLYLVTGLAVGEDRVRPDGVLAPEEHFVGQGEWARPDGALMTVEGTLRDAAVDRRSHKDRRRAYASVGIPVHLLVDRETCTMIVYSDPSGGSYGTRTSHSFGSVVELPEPVGITLETEKLKDYVH